MSYDVRDGFNIDSMNICILAPENSPSWGGVGSYTYNLVKNLPDNCNIHIVTIGRDIEDPYMDLFDDDIHVHEIVKVKKDDTFFYNLKFQLVILKKLKQLNKKYKFDVIHSHSGHLPHLFSQFQNIAPMIVTVHATVKGMKQNIKQSKLKPNSTEYYMNLFSYWIELFEKIGFKRTDRLLPVSKFTLKQINEDYGVDTSNRAKIMNTAVDINCFYPKNNNLSDMPVLLFVGRFYAIKGVETFLDAIEMVVKKGYSVKPLLIGRGDNESVTKRLSSIMSTSDFTINRLAKYSDMPGIYDRSDILIVSSTYENCPITILEAMSSGKIVVASNVGGIPEIITDGYDGFLFETGNFVELADILTNIFEGAIDVSKIGGNARNTIIQKYNWETRGKEISRVYEQIMRC